MITAFVVLVIVALIFFSGFCAAVSFFEAGPFLRWCSLALLAAGFFGIYALIVGK